MNYLKTKILILITFFKLNFFENKKVKYQRMKTTLFYYWALTGPLTVDPQQSYTLCNGDEQHPHSPAVHVHQSEHVVSSLQHRILT